MQRVNGYPIYQLGSALGSIRSLFREGLKFKDVTGWAYAAKGVLDFLAGEQFVPLKLSKDAALTLRSKLDPLLSLESGKMEEPFTFPDYWPIWQAIESFQAVLSAELARSNIYYVSAKRGWDMDLLVDQSEVVLSELARSALNTQTTTDVREAGRCIAFGLPTAAGFHIFRLVEAYALLYFPVLKIDPPTGSQRNLGNLIKLIEKKGADEKVVAMLTHLKDTYRNPIMHPEITLSQDEAETLFGLAQSVIAAIVSDIGGIKSQGPRLPLQTSAVASDRPAGDGDGVP